MIAVRLMGGLGNQMFQYAAARRLALKNETELKLDLGVFEGEGNRSDTVRRHELHHFRLFPTVQLGHSNRLFRLAGKTPGIWGQALAKLIVAWRRRGMVVPHDPTPGFNPAVLDAPDGAYLIGYWQSEKYFKEIKDTIRSDFTFKERLIGKNLELSRRIANSEAVSLHVRRGDYVTNPNATMRHGVLSLDYYRAGIRVVAGRASRPRIFIFSDDPGWCKANLQIDLPATFVDHNPEEQGYEDMRLMSLCKHHIIANSSFSWWGAWLNPSSDKIVVAPKQWFREQSVETTDLIPERWIRL